MWAGRSSWDSEAAQALGCCERRLRLPVPGPAMLSAWAGAWSQCCQPATEEHTPVDAALEMPGQVEGVPQDSCLAQGSLQAQGTHFSPIFLRAALQGQSLLLFGARWGPGREVGVRGHF